MVAAMIDMVHLMYRDDQCADTMKVFDPYTNILIMCLPNMARPGSG